MTIATQPVSKPIAAIADDGEYFPMKPEWARNVITAFARFAEEELARLGGTLRVSKDYGLFEGLRPA